MILCVRPMTVKAAANVAAFTFTVAARSHDIYEEKHMISPRVQKPYQRRRPLAAVAATIGFALLATWGMAQAKDAQGGQPYHYVVGKTIPPEHLGPLTSLAEKNIPVRKATLVTSKGKTVADMKFATTKAGPVLVRWNPRVITPFLRTLPPIQQVTDLAPVLVRHMSRDATVLAWWDVSRELRMLTGLDVVFGKHLNIPLFVPVAWHGEYDRIRNIESVFWQTSVDPQDRARFKRFVDALLAKPRKGVAMLRELVKDKPAVLVLHVRDIILLGQLAPKRIGVAFRDVTGTGNVHAMISGAKRWLMANDYTAYTVRGLGYDHQVREIALMDKASANTLAARLLPFVMRAEIEDPDVPGVKLVYKTGGFWVYKLVPKPKMNKVASNKDTTVEEE